MTRIQNRRGSLRTVFLPVATLLVAAGMALGAGLFAAGRGALPLGPAAQAAPPSDPMEVATALSDAFGQVADQVLPAVVSITSERVIRTAGMQARSPFPDFFERFMTPFNQGPQEFRQQGLGSGVIVRDDGIILTANHVVENAENVTILMSDDREFEAEVVGTDPATDLAGLRVKAGSDLPFARLTEERPRVAIPSDRACAAR
jgi:serine protease Do